MTEQQAIKNGYNFTGCYERSKEELEDRFKKYKSAGYKCCICKVPDSKLSRGSNGCGYSIYIEQKYFIDKEILILENNLKSIEKLKTDALKHYEDQLKTIDENFAKWQTELKEAYQKLK